MKMATLTDYIADALKDKGIEVIKRTKSDRNKEKLSDFPDKTFVCQRCREKLKGKKIPPASQLNKLELDKIPNDLHSLNELEMQLLAMRIPFMKMVFLPIGGQRGVCGGVVNVPADYQGTVEKMSLPHNFKEGKLLAV